MKKKQGLLEKAAEVVAAATAYAAAKLGTRSASAKSTKARKPKHKTATRSANAKSRTPRRTTA